MTIVLRHLPELFWVITLIGCGWAIGLLWLFRPRPLPEPIPGLLKPRLHCGPAEVEQILRHYETGELLSADDGSLVRAAEALRHSGQHLLEEADTTNWSAADWIDAETRRERLRRISEAIWHLISKRYGCDD